MMSLISVLEFLQNTRLTIYEIEYIHGGKLSFGYFLTDHDQGIIIYTFITALYTQTKS